MSAEVTIAKLESLLTRVLARSAEKRPARPSAVPEPAQAASAAPPPVVLAPAPQPAPPVSPSIAAAAAPPVAAVVPAPEAEDKPTIPPAAPLAALDEPDVDIAPVVEVSIDNGPDIVVSESVASDDLLDEVSDSRERLVAADPFPPDPVDPFPAARADAVTASVVAEVEEDDAAEDSKQEDSKEEEAPVSSRRPVAPAPEERLAELAFGAEEPPAGRTPPPKSGPLPSPPLDFDPDVTGVRKSVPPGASDSEPPAPVRLTPHVARLQVTEGRDPIVDVIGEAQRFSPPTFISLLEATLSL